MTKVGILVHSRNLSTIAWEELVYGLPEKGKLGDLATLARVMLTLNENEEVVRIVIGRGPSMRDGLDEGDYTKKFFIDRFDDLREFDLLKPLFEQASEDRIKRLRLAINDIVVTDPVISTLEEMKEAAAIFKDVRAEKVVQIAAASHAPRCLKEEGVLRSQGIIDNMQLWMSVATDMAYHDTTPADVLVIEPLHRFDQPLTNVRPGLSEVIAPYFTFGDEERKAFIKWAAEFMTTRNHLP